jgi:hypothetical protein
MVYSQNMVKFFYGWSSRKLQNWKNEKIKKFIDVIIIINIYNSLIYLFSKWKLLIHL